MSKIGSVSYKMIYVIMIMILLLSAVPAQAAPSAPDGQDPLPPPMEAPTGEAPAGGAPVIEVTATPAPLDVSPAGRRHHQHAAPQGLSSMAALPNPGNFQAVAITLGISHACALTSSGGVKCWGLNAEGELGDGTTNNSLVAVDVVGLTSGVQSIGAYFNHTCAVLISGALKCWGTNEYGELGDGNGGAGIFSSVPVNVVGLSSGVKSTGSGTNHTCAVMTNGALKCWGDNSTGQLGDGTLIDSYTPVNVVGMSSGVQFVTGGDSHTCALLTSGAVKCWGLNDVGQLGDGTLTDHPVPGLVSGLTKGVQGLVGGGSHNCAFTTSGTLKCWGSNEYGELGNGFGGVGLFSNVPVNVLGLGGLVGAVGNGYAQTCGVLESGALKCWGDNQYGQLGDGTLIERHLPVLVYGLSSGVKSVSGEEIYTCALMNTGLVKCWGENSDGNFGNGTTTSSLVPVVAGGTKAGPLPLQGFNSQFSGGMSGWAAIHGTQAYPYSWMWGVNGYTLYSPLLGRNGYASSAYTLNSYSNLDYIVRFQRLGCDLCASSIFIRGTAVSGLTNWTGAYQFSIRRDGSYLVGKAVNAKLVFMKNWTATPFINKGSNWNVLRVVARGSNIAFYINDNLVWSGTDTSFSTGKVGFGLNSNGSGGINRMYVDYAKLTIP